MRALTPDAIHAGARSPGFICLVFPPLCPQPPPTDFLHPGFTIASRLAPVTGRIGFVFLRISGSPPVALHPLSRERSYLRLQAGCKPDEDSHLAGQADSPAH